MKMDEVRSVDEQFKQALSCRTRAEADIWFEKEVAKMQQECSLSYFEASSTLRDNLGYMAGYYDPDVAKKVFELFGAVHPVFRCVDYGERYTAEDMFRMGYELGNKLKRKSDEA